VNAHEYPLWFICIVVLYEMTFVLMLEGRAASSCALASTDLCNFPSTPDDDDDGMPLGRDLVMRIYVLLVDVRACALINQLASIMKMPSIHLCLLNESPTVTFMDVCDIPEAWRRQELCSLDLFKVTSDTARQAQQRHLLFAFLNIQLSADFRGRHCCGRGGIALDELGLI
jgi:hypothetical protein